MITADSMIGGLGGCGQQEYDTAGEIKVSLMLRLRTLKLMFGAMTQQKTQVTTGVKGKRRCLKSEIMPRIQKSIKRCTCLHWFLKIKNKRESASWCNCVHSKCSIKNVRSKMLDQNRKNATDTHDCRIVPLRRRKCQEHDTPKDTMLHNRSHGAHSFCLMERISRCYARTRSGSSTPQRHLLIFAVTNRKIECTCDF